MTLCPTKMVDLCLLKPGDLFDRQDIQFSTEDTF